MHPSHRHDELQDEHRPRRDDRDEGRHQDGSSHDEAHAHDHAAENGADCMAERLRAVHDRLRAGRVSRMAGHHQDRSEERDCQDSGGLSHFLRSLLAGIPWSERASEDIELRFDAPAAGVVDLHNANGKTRIIGEDRSDVLLRGRKNARAESEQAAQQMLAGIRMRAEQASGTLELESEIPRKWNRHGSIDIEMLVPRDTAVQVTSSNGKVCLQGLRHGARAHSSNGSVRLDDVVGDIEITTANAKVCCSCTCGRLVARSSNGKIEVGDHSGAIDATTSNGMIRASLSALAEDGVTLATSNGRIVLELPTAPDADVDIRVDNGVIRSELPVGNDLQESAGRLRGRLGQGGSPIKLRTSNGTICVREG